MATTKKATVKKAASKKSSGAYNVRVETGGKVYEDKTDNIAETLLGFGVKYTNTKTKFVVSKGNKEREVTHFRPRALRILKNGMAARFFAAGVQKFLG